MKVPKDADRDFTAGAYIVKDGRVLLLNHKKLDMWLQPGGHVEEGETPTETAKREVLEETGHEISIVGSVEEYGDGSTDLPEPFNVNLHRIKDGHWHLEFQYMGKITGRVNDYEYSEEDIEWFSKSEIEELDDIPENARRAALKALEKY
ncbi:MAG: NUDIX domain-containing protein [Nanohaloarchaea archaeon]|nr:NUDIX domain-containing protein [Candidatus Nanohaloarchaea archaeon]